MKNIVTYRVLTGLLIAAIITLVPSRALAVAGTIYFTPNGGTVISGSEITVDVKGNVPAPVFSGGATIGVMFPTNLLQYVSSSSAGGAFGGNNPTVSGGTVNFTVFNFFGSGVNDQMIFRIVFKAKAAGSATLNFTSGTNINDGPTAKQPSTFTIQMPTCPTGQVGTPPNCTTPVTPPPTPSPTPTPTPKPTKPTTPVPVPSTAPVIAPVESVEESTTPVSESQGGLQIQNVKVTATRQENSVKWSLNNKQATPVLTYGTSKNSLKDEGIVSQLEDGSYAVEFTDLKPGTLYYFAIKASTTDNLLGANYSGVLTTRGYPVQLTIQQNGVLAPGAKVKIGERSFVANKNALVTTELGDGKYNATITPSGSSESYAASFTVAKKTIPKTGNPTLQSFVLNVHLTSSPVQGNDKPLYAIIGGILLLVIVLGSVIGFILIRRRQSNQQQNQLVDTDLLAASYGEAIDQVHSNTPQPNLDANNTAEAASSQTFAPLIENEQTIYQQPEPDTSQDGQEVANSVDQVIPQAPDQLEPPAAFDPTALPLPPAMPTDPLVDYQTLNEQQSLTPDTDQLSPELAQVESTEAVTSDEPSAIYDEATGELEIIHHHADGTPIHPDMAAAQQEPAVAVAVEPETVASTTLETPLQPPLPSPQPSPLTGSNSNQAAAI